MNGQGPVFIEAMTYRLGAHSTSDDPSVYRKEVKVQEKLLGCPILRLRKYLESQKLWDGQKEESYLDEVSKAVTDAIKVAKETPRPTLRSLIEDVYFEIPSSLEAQLNEIKSLYHE